MLCLVPCVLSAPEAGGNMLPLLVMCSIDVSFVTNVSPTRPPLPTILWAALRGVGDLGADVAAPRVLGYLSLQWFSWLHYIAAPVQKTVQCNGWETEAKRRRHVFVCVFESTIEGLSVCVTLRHSPALRACRLQKETRATRAAYISCCAVGCTYRFNAIDKTQKFYMNPI